MAPAAQKPLSGDLPSAAGLRISSYSHYAHYESPFQTVAIKRLPSVLETITHFLSHKSTLFTRYHQSLHPAVSAVLLTACILALLGLVFLLSRGARVCLHRQMRSRYDQHVGGDTKAGRGRVFLPGEDGLGLEMDRKEDPCGEEVSQRRGAIRL